jgi:hypothetical protein
VVLASTRSTGVVLLAITLSSVSLPLQYSLLLERTRIGGSNQSQQLFLVIGEHSCLEEDLDDADQMS